MRLGNVSIDRAIICRETVLDGRYLRGETLLLIKHLHRECKYAAVLDGDSQWVGLRSDAENVFGEKFSVVACCYSDLAPTIL